MSEKVYMMIAIMINALKNYGGGMSTVVCPYPVAMMLIRKYRDRIGHVKGGQEFKEGLLTTGAKLLRCQHYCGKDYKQLRWGYSLSCYAYDSSDGVKVLKELWVEKLL